MSLCLRPRRTQMWVCWWFVLHSTLLFLCVVRTQLIPWTRGLKIYLTVSHQWHCVLRGALQGKFATSMAQGDVPLDTSWLITFENSADSSFLTRYKLPPGFCSSEVIVRWKWVSLKPLIIFAMFLAFHTAVWDPAWNGHLLCSATELGQQRIQLVAGFQQHLGNSQKQWIIRCSFCHPVAILIHCKGPVLACFNMGWRGIL